MDKIDLIVIENVLRRMRALGLNQRDLARRTGRSPQALNRVFRFKGPPSRSTILDLARALNCSVEELHRSPTTKDQELIHSPTLLDVLRLLSGYQEAKDFERAIVMAILTSRMEYLERFPEYGKLFRAIGLWKDAPFEPDLNSGTGS